MGSDNRKKWIVMPAVYNVAEMAVLLDLSEWTVYERAKEEPPTIPGVLRIGSKIRFIKSVVNEWLGIPEPSKNDSKAS